jgi:two-component system chemotaxis sensor kinase CheA
MTSESGPPNFEHFLDDFYVECDEHLSVARRTVLALEPLVGREQVDRELLDTLFRSFHSIKGLSAMVALGESEQLAHRLESYLGLLRKGHAHLDAEGLEVLIAGVVAVEQVIAAKRDRAPMPEVATLLRRTDALVRPAGRSSPASAPPSQPAPASPPSPQTKLAEKLAAKIAAGGRAWNVEFVPSPEAAERGMNVNSVRSKLLELGSLEHSEPRIGSSGRVAFRFVLVTAGDEPPQLEADPSLSIAPYVPEVASQPQAAAGRNAPVAAPEAPPSAAPASTATPSNTAPSASSLSETSSLRGGPSTHLVPANVVRVDLGRLDELMRMVGELVLSRGRLEDLLHKLNGSVSSTVRRSLEEINLGIERQLRDLREGVMRIRMVPVQEVFARMQFVVRDMAREQAKQVVLRLRGEDTQIDKFVVERMMDPLLHLVRNAVGHGLETSAERLAAGKPAQSRIDLRAATVGDTVVMEVEDDGRGIDARQVAARAAALGLPTLSPSADSAALLDLLCAPGFSTREEADRASGRGVGMDVVRRAVEELGGSLTLQTELGRGTRFVIRLPLTLAITDALIVGVGANRYAAPQVAVREIVEIQSSAITTLENNELLTYHGGALPLVRVGRFFGLADRPTATQHVLVVGEGSEALGLVVDRLLGLREVVVRPLTDKLVQVPGISGATELGDGEVVLILDVANLKHGARKRNLRAPIDSPLRAAQGMPTPSVVGDSGARS